MLKYGTVHFQGQEGIAVTQSPDNDFLHRFHTDGIGLHTGTGKALPKKAAGTDSGKNAAVAKEALPAYTLAEKVESTPLTLGMENDMTAEKTYEAAEGQYVGVGKGLMGDVVVRVTMKDGAIAAVEVIEQNETATIAGPALETIPNQFIGMKTAEEVDAIDVVSGASVTSGALKEAVKNALAQVK